MQELTNSRTNEMIDPSMSIWGWEVPVYLFFGGLVAGIMIISGYFILTGKYKERTSSCLQFPMISIILLSVGMFTLFLDLEHKLYVWRMYTTFMWRSPMSWGAWILVFVYPAIIGNMFLKVPGFLSEKFKFLNTISDKVKSNPKLIKFIGSANLFLGVLLGIYTGILLSAFGARPLWNSAVLGLLFLVSGLSTAAALVHMLAKDKSESILLAKADNRFIAVEIFMIALYFIGQLSSTKVHIDSAMLLLTGAYAPVFWVFVMGLGLVIPLLIQLLAVNHRINHTPVAPILVISGGLILRFVIVFAGQYSHWTKLQ